MRLARAALAILLVAAAACDDPTGFVDEDACLARRVLSLSVGEVVTGTVGSRTTLCLRSNGAAEYALVPFVGEGRDTLLRAEVLIESRSFLDDRGDFVSASALLGSAASTVLAPELGAPTAATDLFHARLRDEERGLAGGSLPARRPAGLARTPVRPLSAPPVEGALMDLSVSAVCASAEVRTGRVVAVTQHAVVVEDLSNPPGGFTEAQLRGFGAEYDALVHPTVTTAFADPTDIDGNGRVILFFTSGVNQKTPAGGVGVVAGYFWGGDLFPSQAGGSLDPCASSNEGEVLYLAVPDPTGIVTGQPVRLDLLLSVTTTTVAHELQHLINAGRRVHVNGADVLEETWLNEGLSLLAEELLFYAATGLSPRSNLDAETLESDPGLTAAFNRFAQHNVGRFNLHLQAARSSSPIGPDGLTTRGATWAFLRYAADRDPRPDQLLFRALVNATDSGLTNLQQALGADPIAWMADWGVAVLADDLLPSSDSRFQQPSWHLRSLIPALRPIDHRFPIQILGLVGPGAYLVRLQPAGATAYPVFRLGPGRADVSLAPGETTGGALRYGLVRVD